MHHITITFKKRKAPELIKIQGLFIQIAGNGLAIRTCALKGMGGRDNLMT